MGRERRNADPEDPISETLLALATSLGLAISVAARVQAPQTGGADRGNVNKSGAVGGTGAGAMERAGAGAAPGTGGPRIRNPGAPAGKSPGNGTTGSGAAPSGR